MRSYLRMYLSDLIIAVAIPVCIMGLVGSLTYFMIDLKSIYRPGDEWLLKYIVFFYVVAVVLINRIKFTYHNDGTSGIYSVALGGAVLLVVGIRFKSGVDPLIYAGILAVIWFIADRLTKSCHVEDDSDTLAEGIMDRTKPKRKRKIPPGTIDPDLMKETLPRKHPGTAVIYFSLMSLVFFGIGLKVIPEDFDSTHLTVDIKVKTFWCMAAYIFFAFSLLMLTSLSGFRKYFLKRQLAVPQKIPVFWLTCGWVMVVMTLVVADLFPQPTGGGPRLREQVPQLGDTIETSVTLSLSKIKGMAESDQIDEQRGDKKGPDGDEQGQRRQTAERQGR
ncbi:hypothetical protein ACFL1X_13340 [Candidatus Hydrogenedentota bacterium]